VRSYAMLIIKILIYSFIFLSSSMIGILLSKKYSSRVKELQEFKNALNIFKTKIRFTCEPIPEIFTEISGSINSNIGSIFKMASNNMKLVTAGEAWNSALDTEVLNIDDEDKSILKNLSKLLGKTDVEGQISQIELTSTFLNEQISKAEREKNKSEKMYRTLGVILGLAIVIILM